LLVKFISKYHLAIIWAVLTLTACGINGSYLPKVSFYLFEPDKVAHILLFLVLFSLCIFPDRYHIKTLRVLFLILLCTSYGILIEILQATIFINRSYDVGDMIANTAGVITGTFTIPLLKRI